MNWTVGNMMMMGRLWLRMKADDDDGGDDDGGGDCGDGGGDGDGGDGKIMMALVVTDVDDEDNMHSGGTVPPFFLASVWKQNCNLKNIHFHSQREMYL